MDVLPLSFHVFLVCLVAYGHTIFTWCKLYNTYFILSYLILVSELWLVSLPGDNLRYTAICQATIESIVTLLLPPIKVLSLVVNIVINNFSLPQEGGEQQTLRLWAQHSTTIPREYNCFTWFRTFSHSVTNIGVTKSALSYVLVDLGRWILHQINAGNLSFL